LQIADCDLSIADCGLPIYCRFIAGVSIQSAISNRSPINNQQCTSHNRQSAIANPQSVYNRGAMWRFLAFLVFLAALASGAAWYSVRGLPAWNRPAEPLIKGANDAWLDSLYSQNPREAEAAADQVAKLGGGALPVVLATLQDPEASLGRRKAALKACLILGVTATPALSDVARQLHEPELTAEAAVALSFMGREAFTLLQTALASDDPVVRREALRSIGKLKARAPLATEEVLRPLLAGMRDETEHVRTVAATYLGIIHEKPHTSVPALIAGLDDPAMEVRRASATALGSFGESARPAEPALRAAAADRDEDLAREAGLALIRLNGDRDPAKK
jgi:HEAT repeats